MTALNSPQGPDSGGTCLSVCLEFALFPVLPPPYFLPHAKKAAIWRNMNDPKKHDILRAPRLIYFRFL